MTILQPKWLYRFESMDSTGGLWYNDHGEWVYEQGIGSFEDNAAKDLPMDYDWRYQRDGRNWHSACRTKQEMQHWFNRSNVATLLDKGFVLYRYLATEYVHYGHETCFIKETSLTRIILNPYSIWDEEEQDIEIDYDMLDRNTGMAPA